MFQTQLINQVVDWERRLEIEEERRLCHRADPYTNYLAKVQSNGSEGWSLHVWLKNILRPRNAERKHAAASFPAEPCVDNRILIKNI